MFEGVGRSRDEEAGRRSAQSLLATILLGFVGACAVGAVVIGTAGPPVEEVVELDEFTVELAVVETPEVELRAPAPPKARRAAEQDVPVDTPTTPEPDDVVEVQELRDEVRTEVAAGGGTPEGDPDGDPTGTNTGTTGGSGTADCGENCGSSSGPMVLHHSEVQAKRRVAPDYPDQARDMDLGDVSCKVRVTINERGRPVAVGVEACPSVFHDSARKALMKWSFYPAKVGGETVPAQFMLNIRYKLR
ncbi:MAG: energy transducer TonB [Proteobacteria bacterium]|nr:energy transducer TonB [Pseudomonadota bacterium]